MDKSDLNQIVSISDGEHCEYGPRGCGSCPVGEFMRIAWVEDSRSMTCCEAATEMLLVFKEQLEKIITEE